MIGRPPPPSGPSSTLKALLFGTGVAVAVWAMGSQLTGHAPTSGHGNPTLIDVGGLLRQMVPSMRLDPSARDVIEDRRGEPASFPGGYSRGRYAEPPMPDPGADGYQGRQGSGPPPMPPMPYPPGRSSRRPPPGGPVSDDSDWWDDAHFGPQRGQGRWQDCGPSGRRCGPWNNGPMPGDPIHEDPKWRGR